MTDKTKQLTNLDPRILEFQNQLRAQYEQANQVAKTDQILLIGSSTMEIFPIEKWQATRNLGLQHQIYNRGVRATTTADLLAHMQTLVFDLQPRAIFINIGSNDIGFNVPEADFLRNYTEVLRQIHAQLPQTKVYVMAYFPINATDDFGEEPAEHGKLYEHRSNERLLKANEQVAQLAAQHGDQFINVNTGLTDDQGNLRAALTFDGAHMLPAGYGIVLNNLMPYLKQADEG